MMGRGSGGGVGDGVGAPPIGDVDGGVEEVPLPPQLAKTISEAAAAIISFTVIWRQYLKYYPWQA
jgi:hypothetical protein